jgi:pimeloyl-ACP methyl ester carboxylesterase
LNGSKPLYFESFGNKDLPTIVFLHGGGAAGWMWKKQVEALSNRYHCLVPDLPEQGQSVNSGAFSMEKAATRHTSEKHISLDYPKGLRWLFPCSAVTRR